MKNCIDEVKRNKVIGSRKVCRGTIKLYPLRKSALKTIQLVKSIKLKLRKSLFFQQIKKFLVCHVHQLVFKLHSNLQMYQRGLSLRKMIKKAVFVTGTCSNTVLYIYLDFALDL